MSDDPEICVWCQHDILNTQVETRLEHRGEGLPLVHLLHHGECTTKWDEFDRRRRPPPPHPYRWTEQRVHHDMMWLLPRDVGYSRVELGFAFAFGISVGFGLVGVMMLVVASFQSLNRY